MPEQTEGFSFEDRQGGCLPGWSERGWNMEILALRMRNHLIRCRFTTLHTTVELPGYIPVFAHSTRPVDIRRAFGGWHLVEQSPVPHVTSGDDTASWSPGASALPRWDIQAALLLQAERETSARSRHRKRVLISRSASCCLVDLLLSRSYFLGCVVSGNVSVNQPLADRCTGAG